jgi:hypothetical protein
MVTNFHPDMTEAELLAARIRQILRMPQDVQKARQTLQQSRIRSKHAFETKYAKRLIRQEYEPGTLVLLRNNPVENTMAITRKTTDRYIGPYLVTRRTLGGSYVLQEMDGTPLRTTVAAFRLIPYIQRGNLDDLVDMNSESENRSTSDSENE